MKFFLFLVVLSILSLLTLSTADEESLNVNAEQILKENQGLTLNLYRHISQRKGNVFFSPISIHSLLSMAFQGAQGSTAEKLATFLKIASAENAADGHSSILNRLNSASNITLSIANKIFSMEGHSLKANFKSVVEKQFLSPTEELNFTRTAEAVSRVNKWVQDQTKNKIQKIISKSDLNEFTRLVMLNAVYFKGNWSKAFNKNLTRDRNFYGSKSQPEQVKMMFSRRSLMHKHSSELDSQIVQLPFSNKDINMVIILPNRKKGLKNLETKLSTSSFSEIFEGMRKRIFLLGLPRFRIEHTVNNLIEILTKLGLGEMFDEHKANFKGIMEESTCVSKIVQKSSIEVNEEGSEATDAVTFSKHHVVSSRRLRPPPEFFMVDHPFIFLITEKNNNVLFAGRISKP